MVFFDEFPGSRKSSPATVIPIPGHCCRRSRIWLAGRDGSISRIAYQKCGRIYQRQTEQTQSLQAAMAEGEVQKTLLERDLKACQEKASSLEKERQQLNPTPAGESEVAKPRRKSRKPLGGGVLQVKPSFH
ncbi:hypothetical protein FDZ73_17865 [bacterium]|nr:MAG: hypothetical protein FDZ73_17865 [bacterium]